MSQNITENELQLYKSFYNTYPDPILILEDGVISKSNQSAQSFFLLDKEDALLGKKLSVFIDKGFEKTTKEQMTLDSYFQVCQKEGKVSFECKIQNTYGKRIDAKLFLTKVEIKEQNLIQVIIREITEPKVKKIESNQLQAIIEALDRSAIISIADKQGKITKVNEEFCQVAQYSEEELLGKDHNIVNSEHHSKEFWQEMWQAISRGKTWRAEVKNKAKDGSFYWVDTVINPMLDNDGKIMSYLSIRYLITDRKAQELEIQINQKQLQTTEEELRQNLEELEAQRDYIQDINNEIKEKSEHAEKNSHALLDLSKSQDIYTGNLDMAFEVITKRIAKTLNIERVGIWKYDDTFETKIISQKQYETTENGYTFSAGAEIKQKDTPTYFADLVAEKNIIADFAQNHPALVEFVDVYLIPLQISSMLDIPYFVDGKFAGVICCETQGQYKNWTDEDISFVKGIADIITIATKTQQQVEEQEKIKQNEKLLFHFLDKIPAGVFIIDKNGFPFFANNTAQQMLGKGIVPVQIEEIVTVYPAKIAGTEQDYPSEKTPLFIALNGKASRVEDMEIIKDSKRILLEVSASPIRTDSDEIEYAIAIFQDITKRKAQELEIKKKNEELAVIEEGLRQNLEELQMTQEIMEQKQVLIEEAKINVEKQNKKLQSNEAVLKKAFEKMKTQDLQLKESFNALQTQEEELRQNMEELQTTQEVLAYQKNILEVSNRQITKSISYAKTIQSAFLPSQVQIKERLPNSFVIYKPKDIVSGDFYWLSEHGNKTLVGVIDCTGHGVPGAFMSLVASSILNEIINQKGIIQPNLILDELHKGVVEKLNQKEGANNDGMDLSLCLLEKNSDNETKLTFGGVKQNLYITRGKELIELKGNRRSVGGGKQDDRSYIQEEITLQKNDSVFLATDGYADQANEERKSFSKKKFRELMIEVGDLSSEEQMKILEKRLNQHQQATAQRDDITIFGFKI